MNPRISAALLALGIGFGLNSAPAQDFGPQIKFWPLAKITFPVDLTAFNQLNPRPVSIRFYSAPQGGKFTLISNKKPSDLEEIVDTKDPNSTPKRGFSYTSSADGVEEFAVQYEFADGALSPKTPQPSFRIHFDVHPPTVKATATSGSAIRWSVEDDNLVRDSIRIEGRYVGRDETGWQFLKTGELRAEDSFKWDIPADKTLEVRVYARDKAGNENRSAPIKLSGGKLPLDLDDRPKAKSNPGSFGDPVPRGSGKTGYGGDDFPTNQPKIEFVNTNKLIVRSKVTHITRSGVKAAQLYVQESTKGADWTAAGKPKEGLAITSDSQDAERIVEIPFDAPRDGRYGFIIQPISGAGTKAEDPRPGDTAQFLVEVDTTPPEFAIKNVRVAGPGLNGPNIEIEWASKDNNELNEPIVLEYSTDQKEWKPIVAKTQNTGKFTWEILDKKLWRFYVRGSATDKAGNTKLDQTKEPILVDLDKPSGNVDKVNPNGPPTTPRGAAMESLGVSPVGSATIPGSLPPLGVGGRIAPAPVVAPPQAEKKVEPAPSVTVPNFKDEKKDPLKKIDADVPFPATELPKVPETAPSLFIPLPPPPMPEQLPEKK